MKDLLQIEAGGVWAVVSLAVAAAFLIGLYLFCHYLLMRSGKKKGLTKSWMAFVPFACDFYRARITSWRPVSALFIGWFPLLLASASAVGALLIKAGVLKIIFFSVAGALLLTGIVFSRVWKFRFYKAFGYSGAYAVATLLPPLIIISLAADARIALESEKVESEPEKATGKVYGSLAPKPEPEIKAPTGKSASIKFLSGKLAGKRWEIEPGKTIVIGRGANCNIVLESSEEHVSRVHCSVAFDASDDRYIVTDRSSAGTYVGNGIKLEPGQATSIPRGAEIYLATQTNKFILE